MYLAISRRFQALTEAQLRFLYTLCAIVSLAASTVVVTQTLSTLVSHTDECVWAEDRVNVGEYAIYVWEILPDGRADAAGLKVGDRVLSINGNSVGVSTGIARRAQLLLDNAPVDIAIPYVVERDGRMITATITLTRIVRFYLLAIPALSILWVIIGLMVAFSRPKGRVQRAFFVLGTTSIFALSILPMSPKPQGIVVSIMWGIAGMAFYITWLQFFSVFPVDQKTFETPRSRRIVYWPAFGLLVLGLTTMAFVLLGVPLPQWVATGLGIASLATVMLYFLGGLVLLYRGYRELPATRERRPITVILIGSILAGIVLLYIAVLQTTRSVSMSVLYPQYLLPIILVLVLPVSFAYAIFKHQVMDFRPVVRATVAYGATMILL
ncbi:MAG: PDZ domain-containing protein, partial [bacterium]|nr:PDZ domain-containing protein [Candidatus Kapabacteria bacterium]